MNLLGQLFQRVGFLDESCNHSTGEPGAGVLLTETTCQDDRDIVRQLQAFKSLASAHLGIARSNNTSRTSVPCRRRGPRLQGRCVR